MNESNNEDNNNSNNNQNAKNKSNNNNINNLNSNDNHHQRYDSSQDQNPHHRTQNIYQLRVDSVDEASTAPMTESNSREDLIVRDPNDESPDCKPREGLQFPRRLTVFFFFFFF